MVQEGYLSVREAAREITVHEHTLRNWERRGLIQVVRLPGSGYRRVPVSEVERIKRGMNSRAAPGALLEKPSDDEEAKARGRALAEEVKSELATADWESLEGIMERLRGISWSS